MKKYKLIYADPPWQFLTYSDKGRGKAPDKHYGLMSYEDIKSLDVRSIAAGDCVLFLWVTWWALKEGLDVIERWGFDYSCCGFNWIKQNRKSDSLFMGLGKWTRNNSEVCLIGKRGSPLKLKKSHKVREVIVSRREEHSKKPEEAYVRLEELFGRVNRIELFARARRKDWDAWGNEVGFDADLGGKG